ncbi:MAG: carbohydrate-binding family 9-like protein [Clostridia bacterium]|nr:carbohydrate-binding family 9-like protein [Clostridia bacterium]
MNIYQIKKATLADLPIDSNVWNTANEGSIDLYPWEGYQTNVPLTNFYMLYDKEGIGIKFYSNETNPVGNAKGMNTDVYTDSCVEIFFNAAPEQTDKYLNFELSVTGYMHLGFGSGRFDRELQYIDFSTLHIDTRILEHDKGWEAKFYIPFSLLEKYYPKLSSNWNGNFQKLCEDCEIPHLGCWNLIETEKPDFHRPEFFGEITLES